jgi:uncharacterized repeat protein (TIGR02543 family)
LPRHFAAQPLLSRGENKHNLQKSLSLSIKLGLIGAFAFASSATFGPLDVAHAAGSCPSGTTLTTYNSENYCKVDVTSTSTTFTVPSSGVSELFVILDGGHGRETYQPDVANGTHVPGGAGAHIEANISVTAGQVFALRYSTQGGTSGGGRCRAGEPGASNSGLAGYGGGWAALVANSGSNILVAGGGGGSGCGGSPYADVRGGAGGKAGLPAVTNGAAAIPAISGGSTTAGSGSRSGGTGATTSAGGTGHSTGVALLPNFVSTAGNGHVSGGSPGGGAGGGYYGGGGGTAGSGWDLAGSGGGGGSSFNSGFTVTAASYNTSSPLALAGSVQVLFQYEVPLTFDPQNSGTTTSSAFWPGDAVSLPAAPAKQGHDFTGWYTANSGGTRAGAAGDTYSPAGSSAVTLFAQWTPASYTVTFNSQGGSSVANSSYTYNSGMSLPAAPTKPGNTFKGWYSASTGGSAITAPHNPQATAPFTLFAQWTPNTYVASFDGQGGVAGGSISYNSGESITLPAAPTQSGMTFRGWYSASEGGQLLGLPGASYTPYSDASITMYAQWTEIPRTTTPAATIAPGTTAPAGRLAATGANLEWLLFTGILIAITGSGFIAFSRRKLIWKQSRDN